MNEGRREKEERKTYKRVGQKGRNEKRRRKINKKRGGSKGR